MNRQEAIKWYETKLHVNETLGLLGLQNEAARLAIAALRAQEEVGRYRFYYCESEDSYLLGARVDNFYYAHWDGKSFVWDMSRYLPWGEHVVRPDTVWKEHTYPSEPKEISPDEWFQGFLSKQCQQETEKNEPLTLEELREMDGEPVWVERPDGYKPYNGWALVDVSWKAQNVIYLVCAHGSTTLCASLLHSEGKVYRHKPKED